MPRGSLGEPDDRVVRWGPRGQWIAVCRQAGEQQTPRLVIDVSKEEELDRLEGGDETGRFVLLTSDGERLRLDTQKRNSLILGEITETTRGDIRKGLLAYGRRTESRPRVVVQTLEPFEERELPSPWPTLHEVKIDASGKGLWLTTYEPEDEAQREHLEQTEREYAQQDMCASVLCNAFAPGSRRHLGLLWLGDGDQTSFVDLDEAPARPRALHGAVVLDDEDGVELVFADRRERIAGPGCSLVHEHYDPDAVLLRCHEGSAVRYSRWKDGHAQTLDIEGPGHGDDRASGLISGKGSRWLELSGLRTIQAVEHQTWGHVFGDHVLLVGDDVEIRDARTDTRVVSLPEGGRPLMSHGPYVALGGRNPGDARGRVIDVRDGHVVRTFEGEPLNLAASGQVALHDEHGRIYWTPND